MMDVTADKPLQVSIDGTAGPYIRVLVSQLDGLARLLSSHRIGYDVAEHAISWNGTPAVTVVRLGRQADAALVQRVLDAGH